MRRTVAAIPEVYRGITMRSRLEVLWDKRFEDLGWPWVYEPRGYGDTQAGYLPDFLVRLEDGTEMAVEGKPFWPPPPAEVRKIMIGAKSLGDVCVVCNRPEMGECYTVGYSDGEWWWRSANATKLPLSHHGVPLTADEAPPPAYVSPINEWWEEAKHILQPDLDRAQGRVVDCPRHEPTYHDWRDET